MAIVPKPAAGIAAVAAVVLSTAACNDPSVRVSLQVPEAMRGQLRRVTLDVLVPPGSEPFDCDMVAFQEVSAEAVALSSIAQVVAGDTASTPINDIPREGTKLFLARGLDSQDQPILAGCGELGPIEEDEVVDIVAEPVTILAPPPLQVGAALTSPLRFGLTDVAGHPMSGKQVEWTVYGPGGSMTPGTAQTNGQGDAVLSIEVPEAPGPAAVLARARWMADEPEPLIGFQLSTPVVIDVPLQSASAVARNAKSALVGRFGPNGEAAVAVFGAPSGGDPGRAVFIAYRDGASYATVESPPVIGLLTLGKLDRGDRDELFAVIADRWVEIRANGTLSPTVLSTAGVTADEIVSIGPCDANGGDEVLIRAGAQWVSIDAALQVTSSPFATPPDGAVRLIGSGCVTTTTGALRRTVVYGGEGAPPTVVADVNGLRSTPWLTFGPSAGFSTPASGKSAPLLGVEVDTGGVSIARYELLPIGSDELELQKIDEDDVITVPQTPIGAYIDGDDELDVAALLEFGLTDDSETSFRAMVALGVDVEGTRLAGVSEEMAARAVQLLVGDADGDGDEDIVLVSEGQIKIVLTGGAP